MKDSTKQLKTVTIAVPSGIGDISWAISKLIHAGVQLHLLVADGWPYRSVEYCKLIPQVVDAEYAPFTFGDIVAYEQLNQFSTWAEIEALGHGIIYLEPNNHLGIGRPLADWLPDLPADYHYTMNTNGDAKDARDVIHRQMKWYKRTPRPWIGISAASYRGSEAWKTWDRQQWVRFLRLVEAQTKGTTWLMGGGWDDLTYSLSEGRKDLVGKTSVGCVVEALKLMDGFIGFSSGLGVLNTVIRKPTFMLWPDHQLPLSTAWADPEQVQSKEYVASRWLEPEEVFVTCRSWMKANGIM